MVKKSQSASKKNKKGKRRLGHPGLLLLFVLAVICLAAGGSLYMYRESLYYPVCRVEAGVNVSVEDFLKKPDEAAYFTEESDPLDITVPGEYHVQIRTGIFKCSSTLYIQDTIPPTAQPVTLELMYGEICQPEDLVTDITDATEVSVSFVQAPDFEQVGDRPVEILLTDLGGNSVSVQSSLCISPVRSELEWEAGQEPPTVQDFLLTDLDASLVTETENLDLSHVADYTVYINAADRMWESALHVRDTLPPTGDVRDITGYALVPREAEEFVVAASDETEVIVSFETEPDLTYIGTQTVTILLTDEGGNQSRKEALLTLMEDTEAPVITGVQDIEIYAGDAVAYRKGVECTDNCPDGLEFTVDTSQVVPDQEGVYPVIYRAVDLAGNVTEAEAAVTVHARLYTQEEVDALADAVLAKILTDDMSNLQKAEAIFNYVTGNVGYISHSEKGDWIRAAYEGLALKKGDCYVYACTSMELLTRAGIENMMIEKIPTKSSHYWNLVNLEDGMGWYHFDTTPRASDHPRIFMWTESMLMEYSGIHYGSHNYDHDQYPEVSDQPRGDVTYIKPKSVTATPATETAEPENGDGEIQDAGAAGDVQEADVQEAEAQAPEIQNTETQAAEMQGEQTVPDSNTENN